MFKVMAGKFSNMVKYMHLYRQKVQRNISKVTTIISKSTIIKLKKRKYKENIFFKQS